MFKAEDVVYDAFDRTGIYPNPRDSLPGDQFNIGLKLLKGLCDGYNIRNMILSLQRKATLQIPSTGVIVARKDGTVFIDDVASVQKVLLKVSDEEAGELDFVPYQDFDCYPGGSWIYTQHQTGADEFELEFKRGLSGRMVIIHYNAKFPCEVDTEYYLPDEYKELFTLGLGCKLFTAFPRQDEKMEKRFDAERSALEQSIAAKQGDSKMLMYNRYRRTSIADRGDSGAFLLGG